MTGNFYIHAGPAYLEEYGFGAAGCIEIIGNFNNFKKDIRDLSGFDENVEVDSAILELVKKRKLKAHVEKAEVPDIRNHFTREVDK